MNIFFCMLAYNFYMAWTFEMSIVQEILGDKTMHHKFYGNLYSYLNLIFNEIY